MKKLTMKTSILLVAGLLIASQSFAAISGFLPLRITSCNLPFGLAFAIQFCSWQN